MTTIVPARDPKDRPPVKLSPPRRSIGGLHPVMVGALAAAVVFALVCLGLVTGLGRRAGCAVGLGDRWGWDCERVLAELPVVPDQHEVTPPNSGEICADFAQLADPSRQRKSIYPPCGFAFVDRATGKVAGARLEFLGPSARPAELDTFARQVQWRVDDGEGGRPRGRVIARPRSGVLIFAYAKLVANAPDDRDFVVRCGAFDIKGFVSTPVDVTRLTLSLADRWCKG